MEQVLPLDFAIPMHVFARESSEFYDVATATPTGAPVGVAGGMTIVPDGGLELLQSASTIIVPGYANAAATALEPIVLRAVTSAARRGARVASVCSGAFALAQAGLLDGLTATTHWSLAAELKAQFPTIDVRPELLFTDSGAVLTSGGVTAGVDLCLHMLRRDLGSALANRVARRIVMAPREGDQAQFFEAPPIPPADDRMAATQQWMLASLAMQITVADMADHAGMSVRTFHRRFRERAGTTPLDWLRDQRIQRAKELLERTELPLEAIATEVGMGTVANLRAAFRRATSVSPQQYRRHFTHHRLSGLSV